MKPIQTFGTPKHSENSGNPVNEIAKLLIIESGKNIPLLNVGKIYQPAIQTSSDLCLKLNRIKR
jgi:hypothetical protein